MSVVQTLLEIQELKLNPGKYSTGRIEEHSKHLDNHNRSPPPTTTTTNSLDNRVESVNVTKVYSHFMPCVLSKTSQGQVLTLKLNGKGCQSMNDFNSTLSIRMSIFCVMTYRA